MITNGTLFSLMACLLLLSPAAAHQADSVSAGTITARKDAIIYVPFTDTVLPGLLQGAGNGFPAAVVSYNEGTPAFFPLSTSGNYTRRFREGRMENGALAAGLPVTDLRTGLPFYGSPGLLPRPVPGDWRAQFFSTGADTTVHRPERHIAYACSVPGAGHSITAAFHTGRQASGWAFSAVLKGAYMPDAYVPGAFLRDLGYYTAVSRQWGNSSRLNFISFGRAVVQGRALPAVDDAFRLTGTHYYNPGWGYQDGRQRNANVVHDFRPVSVLQYLHNPDAYTEWSVSAAFTAGITGSSSLDWYNAADPRPDYYKNLPGYYLSGAATDTAKAAALEALWKRDPAARQLNWDKLYETNRMNRDSTGNTKGRRSVYLLGEDRLRTLQGSLGAGFRKQLGDRWKAGASVLLQGRKDENDRRLLDLLGGDYFVDLNQFAERSYAGNADLKQQDLNHPDRIVKAGDGYAYDYRAFFYKMQLQAQFTYQSGPLYAFLSGSAGKEGFCRQGLFRNGVFADDSYGNSRGSSFFTYDLSGGVACHTGPHTVYVKVLAATAAPLFDHAFIAPRIRNTSVAASPEIIRGTEAGYRLQTGRLEAGAAFTASSVKNAVAVLRFYHDDYRSFVDYVMRPVDKQRLAAIFDMKWKVSPYFSVAATACWQQYFYTSDPAIDVYRENDTSRMIAHSRTWAGNSFVAAGPQTLLEAAAQYCSRRAFTFKITCRYQDRNFIAMNPLRRTEEAVSQVEPGSALWHRITGQERLPAACTLDLQAGRTFPFGAGKQAGHKRSLYVGMDVSNVLNNHNVVAGAWEQLRFDTGDPDPGRFPSRYLYAPGIIATLKAAVRF